MGLDLCVEGRALPGHESEWDSIIRRSFADEDVSDADIERFQAISQPPYASVGAPRVGYDEVANDWIAERMAGRLTREEAISEFDGHYALALVESEGLPKFTHAGLYEGVDETSFRGKFLESCTSVLTDSLIREAWEHRMPPEAIKYGDALLSAASRARGGDVLPPKKPSILRRIFGSPPEILPLEDQLEIVEAAGGWFKFWGSKGHPIRAYY